MSLYKLVRSFLFVFSAEKAHYLAADSLKFFLKIPGLSYFCKRVFIVEDKSLFTHVFGLSFKNPIGLAAGFDKNAAYFNEFSNLGFGFIEIGTITPLPQDGNPKPRLFRLKSDEAIINRMGFNNGGIEIAIKNLKKKHTNIIIGGNIGKNKITSNENAVDDYVKCFNALYTYVDYFVVNVSSPNTPNLRELQDKEPLENLLQVLQNENIKMPSQKPILLKIAPDLSELQLDDIIEVVQNTNLSGIVATNTTLDRSNLKVNEGILAEIGAGGVSGKPLTKRSTEVIRYIYKKTNGRVPIIGVGGIHTVEDAIEKLDAGASLIQLYTGFIYEGPSLIKRINKALINRKK